MRKELDEKLCQDYPILFKDRHGDMRTTAMCWGFECGDGWYDLIDHLCSLIVFDIEHNQAPDVTVTQVKEKYGTLRFYYDGGDDTIDAYVRFAEHMSGFICEECGAKGNQRPGGWIRTLCDEHVKNDF